MRLDWDPQKDAVNQRKHGVGFAEAAELFMSGIDYLEIFDEAHSDDEERFIAVGPIARGILVVVWTEQPVDTVRIISARLASAPEREAYRRYMEEQS